MDTKEEKKKQKVSYHVQHRGMGTLGTTLQRSAADSLPSAKQTERARLVFQKWLAGVIAESVVKARKGADND